MDIINLKTFVVLASTGSYTKTAQMMLVVQSTISKRIKDLENEIGKELIIRDKKKIALTHAGKVVFEYAEKMISLEKDCIRDITDESSLHGVLRIGCVPTLFETHVSHCIMGFMEQYPDVFIEFRTRSSQYLLNQLTDGRIDICFSYRPFTEKNYVCDDFAEDDIILVTHPGHTEFKSGVTDEQLKKLPLLHENLTCVSDAREWFNNIYRENTSRKMFVGIGNYVLPFLEKGIGYGFVVKQSVKDKLEKSELIEIPLLEREPIKIKSYIIYRNGGTKPKERIIEYIYNRSI